MAGRPRIEFTDDMWEQLENLCAIFCTRDECAGFLKVSPDTLERRIREEYDMTFSEYFEIFSAAGKVSLRRSQFKSAQKGNATMQIWLGKQHLGQRDVVKFELENIPDEVLAREAKRRLNLVKRS